jgi:hypothetical protein
MDKDFVASNGFSVRVNDDGSMQIDNVYVGPEHMAAFVEWSERQEIRMDDPAEKAQEVKRMSVPSSDDDDDDREALAEIVARAIRAGRYSGKMVATPQPPEWHNPVDLRDGRRAVAAILASDVWRNRRQGPITDEMVDAAARSNYEFQHRACREFVPDWADVPESDPFKGAYRAEARAALEAAERARSAVPCVECSGTGWLATHQRDGSATADSCRDCGGSGLRAAVPSPTEQEGE